MARDGNLHRTDVYMTRLRCNVSASDRGSPSGHPEGVTGQWWFRRFREHGAAPGLRAVRCPGDALIIGVKVPEGIAVAADSRATEHPNSMPGVVVAADDAIKMRRIPAVGSMWIAFHGNLSIGGINAMAMLDGFAPSGTLSGKEVADEIYAFYLNEWNARVGGQPPAREENCLGFHVYGASPSDSTPAVVRGIVPGSVTSLLDGNLGIFIAGETEFVERLVYGMAPRFSLQACGNNIDPIIEQGALIKYQDLPLEEARALAVFLVETTAQMHLWTVPHRNNGSTVGRSVQVVTIGIPDSR